MRDFTLKVYRQLLCTIRASGYSFQTFGQYITQQKPKTFIIRHDSDIWPNSDLRMANIESKLDIQASYYFRIPHTYNLNIIRKIAGFGHEIGYHYEELAQTKGNYQEAIQLFEKNLKLLRKIYPVTTIAMHGRPLSKWDSRDMWKLFRLRDFGIIGEVYLSVDFDKVLYLTDTGSRWDGDRVSIRDSVKSNFNYSIRSTFELIDAIKKNELPEQVMINVHPARWNDNLIVWLYRYFLQMAKNTAKKYYKVGMLPIR